MIMITTSMITTTSICLLPPGSVATTWPRYLTHLRQLLGRGHTWLISVPVSLPAHRGGSMLAECLALCLFLPRPPLLPTVVHGVEPGYTEEAGRSTIILPKILTVSLKCSLWFNEKTHQECLSKCKEKTIYYLNTHIFTNLVYLKDTI